MRQETDQHCSVVHVLRKTDKGQLALYNLHKGEFTMFNIKESTE